jgi:hypothetical protein
MCLLRVFLAPPIIRLLCVVHRMCLWLLRMRGLLCAGLLCRPCILCLLVRRWLGLMLLLRPLLLYRPLLLPGWLGPLLLPVLALVTLFLARVGGSSASEKHKQYCCCDWEFHLCHLNLDASTV